jgi:hypothetical protein
MKDTLPKEKIDIYRELSIEGKRVSLQNFLSQITSTLSFGWTRAEEGNARGVPAFTYFRCTETAERKSAKLVLAKSSETKLYVSNIVPESVSRLTRSEYNAILLEFYDLFIAPIASQFDLRINLEPELVDLSHWLDAEAIARLERFSHNANKSTETGHPLDERRWLLFVFYVHEKGFFPSFYPEVLARWLHEVLGWSRESAERLSIQYERSARLLEEYDKYLELDDLPY